MGPTPVALILNLLGGRMDKPRFDHCDNYVYTPTGHWCVLWNVNLKEPCYSYTVCDARNMIPDDEPHDEDVRRYGKL